MISFVIPAFNERDSLTELFDRLASAYPGTDVEFIFVDDGSTDGTFDLVESRAKVDPRFKGLLFRRNFGKSAAMAAGFTKAAGDVLVTMDADLQDKPEEVHKLITKIEEGYDFVVGWKFPRKDPFSKRFPSKVINRVTAFLTGLRIHDMNSGLKAMRREVANAVPVYGEMHRFLPPLAHLKGFRVTEVQVSHSERKFGYSKFGPKRFLSGIFDLTTVLFLSKFGKRPMHLFGLLGLVLLSAGFGINLFILYLKIMNEGILSRLPLLILGVLNVVVGIQFVSLGLIGELLTSLHDRTDHYSIKKEV